MNIAVIAGGLSPERDVSLSSGSLIANALIDAGHKVCLVDLYIGIETNDNRDFHDMFIDTDSGKKYSYEVPCHEPDLKRLRKETNNGRSLIGKNVIEICKYADLAFLALHGDIGENGKLQAVLDSFGIIYTGTGYIGSLLAMDKDLSKRLMKLSGIPTPKWDVMDIFDDESIPVCPMEFPCVIKPCSCGSSVGVSIVNNFDEYAAAIKYASKYETKILIEEMVKGREFSVGILDDEALPVIEIIPVEGFYDYKNKYQSGFTKEVCPAKISDEVADKMKTTALNVHKRLRLKGYSRIDIILDNKDDIYCLEANTLPGMTPTSLLPQEAKAKGIAYVELCEKIVELALK